MRTLSGTGCRRLPKTRKTRAKCSAKQRQVCRRPKVGSTRTVPLVRCRTVTLTMHTTVSVDDVKSLAAIIPPTITTESTEHSARKCTNTPNGVATVFTRKMFGTITAYHWTRTHTQSTAGLKVLRYEQVRQNAFTDLLVTYIFTTVARLFFFVFEALSNYTARKPPPDTEGYSSQAENTFNRWRERSSSELNRLSELQGRKHNWEVKSGCHFSCMERGKGVQIVSSTAGTNTNIQLCTANTIVSVLVTFFLRWTQRFRVNFDVVFLLLCFRSILLGLW